jgi:hypothetical protein
MMICMTTEQEQEKASRSKNWVVRADLAKNPALAERVQGVLAKDVYGSVRHRLAQNPALAERLWHYIHLTL